MKPLSSIKAQFLFWAFFVALALPALALDLKGDGHDWRKASLEERQNLCKDVSRGLFLTKGKAVTWQFIFDALQEFYTSDEPGILGNKIGEVAALAISEKLK
jgi:hypothetical protein